VGNEWTPIQPTDVLDFGDHILEHSGMGLNRYTTAGSLFNRKRLFVTIDLGDFMVRRDVIATRYSAT